MKNKNGFSLVELLAVIVILGILSIVGISAVTRLIEKSRIEKENQEFKTAVLATKNYLQLNNDLAPKSTGESVRITLLELKEAKYLTEDIINGKGQSCMNNSYIEVIKKGSSSYDYKPHIYCGSATPPADELIDKPSFKSDIVFSNLDNLNTLSFSFSLEGSSTNENIEIVSYAFIIYTKVAGQEDYQEVYNSGPKDGINKPTVEISEKVRNYIDLTGTTSIKVTVIARNELGESMNQTAETNI